MTKMHLRYSYQAAPPGHAQTVMRSLGIAWTDSTPQTMGDQWWFWNCTNVPEPLPPYLTKLDANPTDWGVNGGDADLANEAIPSVYWDQDKDFIGPLPYGNILSNGKLYPELCQDCTRYEIDWLQATVLNAPLILQGLKVLADRGDGIANALMQKLRTTHKELVAEGSYDYWAEQKEHGQEGEK
jgi:hypothetical protein